MERVTKEMVLWAIQMRACYIPKIGTRFSDIPQRHLQWAQDRGCPWNDSKSPAWTKSRFGSGSRYSYNWGYGYGFSVGDGHGDGFGDGDGYGDGFGDGFSYGLSYGFGDGFGYGNSYGNDDGSSNGSGYGYGRKELEDYFMSSGELKCICTQIQGAQRHECS